MKLSEKLILTDVDGCLLDWQYSFFCWMEKRGYRPEKQNEYDIGETFGISKQESKILVRRFNESAAIGWLTPFRDAVHIVKKLHNEYGFVFRCITSLSTDEYAGKLRRSNLYSLFGENVFEDVICLDCGADKDDALMPYKDTGCFFIEDKPENALTGHRLGLQPILIAHEHNRDFIHSDIPRVNTWREIGDLIV
jgi:FMN phosphatase YigB (HAD superfamily)